MGAGFARPYHPPSITHHPTRAVGGTADAPVSEAGARKGVKVQILHGAPQIGGGWWVLTRTLTPTTHHRTRSVLTGFSSTSRASACQVEGRGCEPRNPDHWDCSSFRRAPALQAGGGEGRARQFHHPLPSSISQDACLSNRKGRGSTGWEYHSTAQVLRAAYVARTYGGAGQNCGAVPVWGQGQEGRHGAGSAEGRERYPVAPPL
jgi:hypothetical protein